MYSYIVRLAPRILATSFVLALGLAANGCGGQKRPNDPLVALFCDKGYIMTADGDACLSADNLIVHGVVFDSALDTPIAGVAVTIYPFGAEGDTVTTDAAGYFSRQGAATTDNILVTYEHVDYAWEARTFTEDALGIGMVVINASLGLTGRPQTLRVAGTVYAVDAPAVGAEVSLGTSMTGAAVYRAQTDTDGRFVMEAVQNGSYWIRVMPYDEDGDLVTDYGFDATFLGALTTSTVNVSNLVLSLPPVSSTLLYTNLIGGTLGLPTVLNAGGPYSGMRLTSTTANILFHFGASVNTSTVEVVLRPWEPTGGYGDEIPTTIAWTLSNTVMTVDPQQDLVADADTDSQYEITIRSLHWADGSIAIPQNDPNAVRGFRFDIDDGATLLVSPTPNFYIGNKLNGTQTADSVSCDAEVCWLLDADFYYYGGFADPLSAGSMVSAFNHDSGFQLVWNAVPGATSFNIYARQRNTNGTSDNFGNWYLVTGGPAVSTVDPVLGSQVYAAGVMADNGGAFPREWDDFDVRGMGPLAFGNMIDIAVTAEDVNGFESPIDSSLALTLSDETPAALSTVNPNYNGVGVQASTIERGTSRIMKVFRLDFTEFMDTNIEPILEVTGGMITGFQASSLFSWDPTDPVTPENVSRSGVLGPMDLTIRGACTPITCAATFNGVQPSLSDDRICVVDTSVLAGATDVFFIHSAGSIEHGSLGVAGLDPVNGVVNFTAAVSNNITPPGGAADIMACAANSLAGHVASLTAAPTSEILSVTDATLFYAGESLIVFDRSSDDLVSNRTVNRVNTAANTVTLSGAGAPAGVFNSGTTVVMFRPTAAEYGYRAVSNPSLRMDTTVSGATPQLDFTPSLDNSSVMVDDIVLVDVDGSWNTAGDRFFATVTEIVMTPDDGATAAIDETDYHLILGAPPAGMSSIPIGTLLRHGVSLVLCLGDSFRVVNGDPASATPMADTSGNIGMVEYRDQFSLCASGLPWCTGGRTFY